MANELYKQADDKTPFAPLVSSPTDPDPFRTLRSGDSITDNENFGKSGVPWQPYARDRARAQADRITAKEQGAKSSKIAAAKKKRKGK